MPRGNGTGPRGQGPGTGRVIVFARAVVKGHPTNWGVPVMNRNAPSAERPCRGSRRPKYDRD